MEEIKIDARAEKSSRDWIDILYVISSICCAIMAIFSLIAFFKLGWLVGICLLVFTGLIWAFSKLLCATLSTFVNISYKLDYCEDILKTLERIEKLHTQPLNNKECIETPQVNIPLEQKKEEPKHNVCLIQDDEFKEEIINLINAGKELDARQLLIRKKNISLSGSIAYVETLKNMTR